MNEKFLPKHVRILKLNDQGARWNKLKFLLLEQALSGWQLQNMSRL